MNLELSPDRSPQPAQPTRSIGQLRAFFQQHLVSTIVLSTCLNLGLTGTSTWSVWQTSQRLQATIARQDRQQDLSSRLTYLDEVLTMSARMFASTGQAMWAKRYNDNAPKIDSTIAELTKDLPPVQEVDAANKKLLGLEDLAFKLAQQAKLTAASAVLSSPEYQQNKQIYAQGVATTISKIKTTAESEVRADRQALGDAILLALVSLGLLVVTGLLVVLTVRSYMRDREQSQRSLQAFQANLLTLNDELKHEAELRTVEQERVVRESDTLQTDISHILDIVSLLEDGDLTVQAAVNERSTGLIADTLNRLIESLHQVVTVVASSADRVAGSALGLEQLAVETASQAQHQTRSIQQIETLIAQVNSLSTNSQQQALATIDAVALAQAAVGNGQQEMKAMADGIASLQQGTEQISVRMQRLNEFVELAAQFSKDQKRVAALTRVLALNASLLSTRAVKEQDPTQFASLAHEFETIAERVNELAGDTNDSLVSLQHRTNQIQTVTSGLDRDVADINQLVQKFTDEMGKSRQAFTNIQLVTDRVAIVGAQVSTSSQDIIRVVGDTLQAIGSIGVIAQSTEHKAIATREQIEVVSNLAQNLLARVEFFRLNDETPSAIYNFLPPADSTVVKNPEAVYDLLQPRA
ncbi:methyl-accepting chemotaxis protein [Chamaesiphon sp.]|uniref:methyl-accepting chemotaxis protein n=1 Tax=Chamaesiphon sp. TaxID=2814140 RepID=UPI0035942FBA